MQVDDVGKFGAFFGVTQEYRKIVEMWVDQDNLPNET